MGEKLGYQLVAEGIESEATFKKLQTLGCEFDQGYYISWPGEIVGISAEIESYLDTNSKGVVII